MAIYTRKGDKGKTSLANGQRVSKTNARIDTLGSIDELNSLLGVVVCELKSNREIKKEILEIQRDLLKIGVVLANPIIQKTGLEKRIKDFEILIDNLTEKIPRLSNFIVPGGGRAGSLLHFARTVCRRVERKLVLLSKKEKIDRVIIVYINRLSDLLFTMARFTNHKEKIKEEKWKNND